MIKTFVTWALLALSSFGFGMGTEKQSLLEKLRKKPTSFVSVLPRELVIELQHFVDDQIRQALKVLVIYNKTIEKLKKLADLKIHAHYFKDPETLEIVIYTLVRRFGYSADEVARQLREEGIEEVEHWIKEIRPKQNQLFNAIRQGNIDAIKELIAQHINPNARNGGDTALITAASSGFREVAQYLLEQGADIDAQNNIFSYTALMIAIIRKHPEMVKLLLNHGANLNLKCAGEKTALDFAEGGGDKEIIQLLKEAIAKQQK